MQFERARRKAGVHRKILFTSCIYARLWGPMKSTALSLESINPRPSEALKDLVVEPTVMRSNKVREM